VLLVLIGGHRALPLRLRRCVSAPVLVFAGDGPFRRGNGSDGLNTRPLSDNIAIPGDVFRTAQQPRPIGNGHVALIAQITHSGHR